MTPDRDLMNGSQKQIKLKNIMQNSVIVLLLFVIIDYQEMKKKIKIPRAVRISARVRHVTSFLVGFLISGINM